MNLLVNSIDQRERPANGRFMIDVGLAIDLFAEDETGFLIMSDRVGDALVEVVVRATSIIVRSVERISPAEHGRLRSLIRRDG
jgi:hypothetical protein